MFRIYTTDMHLEGAFRKEATIPDDMLPKAWRNKPTLPEQQQELNALRQDEF
jgi:hypothetical protein